MLPHPVHFFGGRSWVIAFDLRTAKGIGHYHPQPALFRVLSHNPSLSACRFRKLATPIDLALGQLSSLQAGAFDSANMRLRWLRSSWDSWNRQLRAIANARNPVRAWLPLVPQRKRPLTICPAAHRA